MGIFTQLKEAITGPTIDYKDLVAKGAVVVDVRTKDEFRQGHCKGSLNIPMSNLSNKVAQFQGKTVVLVCRSGARAGQAKNFLKDQNITAYNAGPWQTLA